MCIANKFLVAILITAIYGRAFAAPFLVGVCTHPYEEGYSVSMLSKSLSELGATSYRSSISWEYVERSKGVYAIPENYRTTDEMLLGARSLGVEPLVILDYGNPLYQADGLVTTEEAREGFANYVRWMVSRYKGRVRYYEIWNEWYIGLGARGKPRKVPSVEDYVALLERIYPIIKKIDPNAVVLGGGAGEGDTGWFKHFSELGGSRFVDGVSIHPYNYGRGGANNTPEASLAWVDDVHNVMSGSPSGNKKIYVTEIGWPSHDIGYDEMVVAAYLSRFYLLARARSYIAGVWWYDLYDDGPDAGNREHNFGLIGRNQIARPSFRALASVAHALKGLTGVRAKSEGASMTITATRADGGEQRFAWSLVAIPSRKAPLADYEGDAKVLLGAYDGRLPTIEDRRQFGLLGSRSPVPVVFSP